MTIIDPTTRAADEAAEAAGFDGTNPQVIAGLLFALSDILTEAGYEVGDVTKMYRNVADKIDSFQTAD